MENLPDIEYVNSEGVKVTIAAMMPNVLLMGGIATGKSSALKTILDAGLELFVLQTEPSEVLDDLPLDRFHKHFIKVATVPWATMKDNADKINKLSYHELSKLEGMNKAAYRQFIEFVDTCNNFKCDRCGKSFGDVMTWGLNRAFVVDSLTGLSTMALNNTTGANPTRTEGEWGVAMDQVDRVINNLVTGTKCLFVLTAHLEREPNLNTGGTNIMVSTLGKKLAPKIPRPFSDVILTERRGAEWSWNTIKDDMDLKARNLPWAAGQKPDFKVIIETWRARWERALAAVKAGGQPAL